MNQKTIERGVKVLADGLFLGAAILSLERWALDQIESTTPDDLYYLIEKGESAVLSQEVLQWAKPLYQRFHIAFEKYTADYLLELLRIKRPELWGVVSTHPRGKEWLETRLQEIKTQLS